MNWKKWNLGKFALFEVLRFDKFYLGKYSKHTFRNSTLTMFLSVSSIKFQHLSYSNKLLILVLPNLACNLTTRLDHCLSHRSSMAKNWTVSYKLSLPAEAQTDVTKLCCSLELQYVFDYFCLLSSNSTWKMHSRLSRTATTTQKTLSDFLSLLTY